MPIIENKKHFLSVAEVLIDDYDLSLGKNLFGGGLTIYDHNFSCILRHIRDSDDWLKALFSHLPNIDLESLIGTLENVIIKYSKIINFPMMFTEWDRLHMVVMKEHYSSPHDILAYKLNFTGRDNIEQPLNFIISLYFEPIEAVFNVDRYVNDSGKSDIFVKVYYKDIESIINPLLLAYPNELEKILGFQPDAITTDVIKILDMIMV